MDTLQAHARLLAQQTEAVKAGDGSGANKQRLCQLYMEGAILLRSLAKAGDVGAHSPARSEAVGLLDELCAALADSAILEHLSRALMLVTEDTEATVGNGGFREVLDSTEFWCVCSRLGGLLADRPASSTPAASRRHAHLRAVLSGRCLQHLMACQLVATLRAADGGTSYGMPGEPSLGLSMLSLGNLFFVPGSMRDTAILQAALMMLARMGVTTPTRLRPLRAFTLLLRLARVAAASMQPQPPAPELGLMQLPLPAAACAQLAETALDSCDRILSGPLAARAAAAAAPAAAAPGPDVRALRRQWWQAKVELERAARAQAGRA